MTGALYINGVFETVLEEIRAAQADDSKRACYLQPYSGERIKLLAETVPTPNSPVRLYVSLTDSLSVVSYRAMIVGWRDKRELSEAELARLNEEIRAHQPKEKEIFRTGGGGQVSVNLLSIIGLERLSDPTPVSSFIKISDGTPLKKRSRSGGWSYVDEQPSWVGMLPQTVIEEQMSASFNQQLERSSALTAEARRARLESAPRVPEAVQVLSYAFRRNPDVVADILERAAGICERCHTKAPFLRASDATPYLEVHHRITLARGGEDTVENAIALCPNCHRELHFGPSEI